MGEERKPEATAGSDAADATGSAPTGSGRADAPPAAASPTAEDVAGAPVAEPRGVPWKAELLAWLVPGLGHLYAGRWARGAFYALIVFSLVAGGCALQGRLWLPAGNPLGVGATSALLSVVSLGMGLPYVVLAAAGYRGEITAQGYEYGTTFLLTAALMNLLLVFDARDVSLGRKR